MKTILFQGDSITDMARIRDGIGVGYVKYTIEALAEKYPDLQFLNRGVGGNRTTELVNRWEEDTLSHKPYLVTLLCGINDVWLYFRNNQYTSDEQFEKNYCYLVESCLNNGSKMILMQPFMFHTGVYKPEFDAELYAKFSIVDKLAEKFQLPYLRFRDIFNDLTKTNPPELYTYDGIHLAIEGRKVVAQYLAPEIEKLL